VFFCLRALAAPVAALCTAAVAIDARADEISHQFEVPAQSVRGAIDAIAAQSELRPAYVGDALEGLRSPGVRGRMTASDAFTRALAGTGLGFRMIDARTVAIAPAARAMPAGPVTLGTVEVRDTVPVDDPQSYSRRTASTATITDTPLLETPVKVDVVTRQVLLDKGLTSRGLAEALATFGITGLGQGDLGDSFFFRGFDSSTTLWNGFRIEDLSTNAGPINGGVWLDNVERLEVLRGPSSILYGRAEPGGAVNVVTRKPQAAFAASVAAGIGSYSQRWFAADVSGPLTASKSLRYRLNLSREDAESRYRFGNDYTSTGIAPALEWQLAASTVMSYEGQYRWLEGGASQPYIPVDTTTQTLLSIDPRLTLMPGARSEFDQRRSMVGIAHRFNDDWSLNLRHLYNDVNSPLSVVSLVVGIEYPGDLSTLATATRGLIVNRGGQDLHATQFDLIGRVDGFGLRHTLLFGASRYAGDSFQDTHFDCFCVQFDYLNPPPVDLADTAGEPDRYTLDQREWAFYVQDQVVLPFNLHLLAGLRYQRLKERSLFIVPAFPEFDVPGLVEDIPYRKNIVLPRAGLLWQPQSGYSAYYSYSENAGASQGLAFPGRPIRPEFSRQHEIGAKAEWLDGRVNAAVALFELTKTNVVGADPDNPSFNLATGRVRSRGYELSLQGALTPRWNVVASLNHARPYVQQGTDGGAVASQPLRIIAGSRLPYVSEHSASLLSSVRLSQWRLGGGLNWFSAANRDEVSIVDTDPYLLVSMFAAWETRMAGHPLTMQINADNLLDKEYLQFQADVGAIEELRDVNFVGGSWGAPRTLRVSLRMDY
jgi:iron complex outermembrane receptor protein